MAAISNTDVVTAVALGEVVIIVTTRNGGKTVACTATLNEVTNAITMITAKEDGVGFWLADAGTAVINWGYGSANRLSFPHLMGQGI